MLIAGGYVGGRTPFRTFLGAATSQGSGGPAYTFSGVTLTKAGLLVLAISGNTNINGKTLNSVTVNGAGATIQVNQNGDHTPTGTSIAAIASIPLGAGATGNVVITFSAAMLGASYMAYQLTGLRNNSPFGTGGNRTTGTPATSLAATCNIPNHGVFIATASCVQTSISLSGATNDATQVINAIYQFICGSDHKLPAETNHAFSSSKGGAASAYGLAGASWN